MITRRRFIQYLGASIASGLALGGYAVAVEPNLPARVTRYRLTPPGWPKGLRLRIAALADFHACRPWMSPERIAAIVDLTNALSPDVTVLLGDYEKGMKVLNQELAPHEWAAPLGGLRAPHGVHAILGNHDWYEDKKSVWGKNGPCRAIAAMQSVGLNVLDNESTRIEVNGQGLWFAGLGDQLAFHKNGRWGRHDMDATMAMITNDDEPVILLAHEPDIFPKTPDRVSLTLSGHCHGGQVRLFGWAPYVPSKYGNRYGYGHIVENDRHLIVSGGLGCSRLPIRIGVPPEVLLIELGDDATSVPQA